MTSELRARTAPPTRACPLCDGGNLVQVLSWPGVPTSQNAPMARQAEALDCRRGDMRLVHCSSCGFVFNAAFDASLTAYAPGYEPSQAHSRAFLRYLDELARELIARHALRSKTVLEIGCGAGEFLLSICRQGASRGIGYDPSYAGDRANLPPNVTIRSELYARGGALPPADLVCARHVIEHMPRPVTLLADMRSAVETREGAAVFVETPRLEWILDRAAFWDIFYEHCSYFTAPALGRVMTQAGLTVLRAGECFGGQYQWMEGRPGTWSDRPPAFDAPSMTLEALGRRLDDFARVTEAGLGEWRERVATLARRGTCVIWGAGAKGVTFLNALGLGLEVVPVVVDMNPRKWGRYVPGTGQLIVPPADLSRYRVSSILVTNPLYLDEIRTLAVGVAPSADVHAI